MSKTLVIAECGSSWDCDLEKAFRLIDAAKACGADIAKFQWTSNAKAMAVRRLGENAARSIEMYKRYLGYSPDVLTRLKAHCDSVGIEFMCTVYLIEDIPVIAPLVKRFKVSAFESGWKEFVDAHVPYGYPIIMSVRSEDFYKLQRPEYVPCIWLHVVSEYPCPLERLKIPPRVGGLSDHTTSLLTGACAVMRCAEVVEKHVRLHDTPKDNPDYGHSLSADMTVTSEVGPQGGPMTPWTYGIPFMDYVRNIREAERCL